MKAHTEFPELKTPDAVLAAATALVDKEMAKEFAEIFPALQQVQQQVQQLIPPPPNPDLQVEQVREQGRQAVEKMRQEYDMRRDAARAQSEAAAEQARAQAQAASEQARAAAEDAAALRREQSEAARHTEEMAMAANNARMAEESERRKQDMDVMLAKMHEMFETWRNNADNKTLVVIEELKASLASATAIKTSGLKETAPTEQDSKQNDVFRALAEILKAQAAPRTYEIRRRQDNSLELLSSIDPKQLQ